MMDCNGLMTVETASRLGRSGYARRSVSFRFRMTGKTAGGTAKTCIELQPHAVFERLIDKKSGLTMTTRPVHIDNDAPQGLEE